MGSGFLALGDSYTSGEGVLPVQRWPVQLAGLLRERGILLGDLTLIAQTGWTTGELAQSITQVDLRPPYDLVSLQVGVNNQYRGLSTIAYRAEFRSLLDQAVGFAGGEPGRVLVLSIPDWGVTPFAAGQDVGRIATEIDAFNRLNRLACAAAGVRYVDLTPISRSLAADPAMLAGDELHPSGKMYAVWAALILPRAMEALGVSG
jgi:lysophospholipase L1-like esterase